MNTNANREKPIFFVVVEKSRAKNYRGGLGYRGPELKELGFPLGPYGAAGAKILVRQIKSISPKKEFEILPFIGEF
jgi:hypothetical protein